MTDENKDSGQVAGQEGTTTPSSSANGDKQGSGFDATKLQSTLESLTKRLDEVDARSKSLQGEKDRGVKRTTDEVEKLKKQIAELEKYRKAGWDDDAAFEEMNFREEVRTLREQIANLQKASAGNGGVDAAKVVVEYGLDPNDPDVIAEITARKWDNPERMELEAARLAKKKQTKPKPTAADAPTSPAPPPPSSMTPQDIEKKAGELRELYKSPTKNRKAIEELEKLLDPHLPK